MQENELLLFFPVFLHLKMFSVSTGLPCFINFVTFQGQLLKKIRMIGSNFISTTYYCVTLAKSLCALCLSFLICDVETKTAPISVGLNVIRHIKCLEQFLTHTQTHVCIIWYALEIFTIVFIAISESMFNKNWGKS